MKAPAVGSSNRFLLGVDLGSSTIRAMVYTLSGTVAAIASRPTERVTPDPARPAEIVWPHQRIWGAASEAIREAVTKMPGGSRIEALSVACLGMDGLPVDAEGQELYPFISWHDTRTVPQLQEWERTVGAERQFLTTGNQLFAFNTAFRLQWMAQHQPRIMAQTHKWVLIGDYLNMKLCGRIATDASMASCTLLFDPGRGEWSEDLVAEARVNPRVLCEVLPSGTVLGGVTREAAAATGLPEHTPVVLGGHDYLCGVLPVGGHVPGTIVNVAGTWDVVQTTVEGFVPSRSMVGRGLTLEAHVAPGRYSIFGAAIGGAVTEWYREQFGPAHGGDGADWYAAASEAAGQEATGLLFLPHLAGANCPVLDPFSAGALVGLRTTHTRSDVLAAVHHGLAYQSASIVRTLAACGVEAARYVIVGGGSKNDAFNQVKADILGRTIEVPDVDEATALGVAMLAGVGVGVYEDLGSAYLRVRRSGSRFEPRPARTATFGNQLRLYEQLYEVLRPTHHMLTDRSL